MAPSNKKLFPETEGAIINIEQKNLIGNIERVEARVAKDKGGAYYLVETRTCFVVRMDKFIRCVV